MPIRLKEPTKVNWYNYEKYNSDLTCNNPPAAQYQGYAPRPAFQHALLPQDPRLIDCEAGHQGHHHRGRHHGEGRHGADRARRQGDAHGDHYDHHRHRNETAPFNDLLRIAEQHKTKIDKWIEKLEALRNEVGYNVTKAKQLRYSGQDRGQAKELLAKVDSKFRIWKKKVDL